MHDEAGQRYQASVPARERRAGGVYYTPADVARGLVRVAVDGLDLSPPRRPTVCDPACGAGALLLAAAEQLESAGHDRVTIVEDLIWGADIDGAAVTVARRSLAAWAAERGTPAVARHVVRADSLRAEGPWPTPPGGGFDVVVGNPPFQSQLAVPTTRDAAGVEAARLRFGAVAAPYADSATLFLVLGCALAAAGGRVAMIQPESVLSARDAGPARRAIGDQASLMGLWWAGEPVFDAGVRVCAPVLELDGGAARPGGAVRRWTGRGFVPVVGVDPGRSSIGEAWSLLLGAFHGTPAVELGDGATLAQIATASAGFRDEYYGVVPHVGEAPAGAAGEVVDLAADPVADGVVKLVTSGLVDPLRCRWGTTPTRFARTRWTAPVVDLAGVRRTTPRLAAWADQRLVPKVVLAGQTRVLEAAVDVDGCWWPSVPTIAVVPTTPGPADLWAVAAVLASPAATAWALGRFGGSALSSDAVKLSAGQVLGLPLPTDRGAWCAGAAAAEAAHEAADRGDSAGWDAGLAQLSEAMTDAYGVGPGVADWWSARRPGWR